VVCHPVLSLLCVITCWADSPPVVPCLQVDTRALQHCFGAHGLCSSSGPMQALHQEQPGTRAPSMWLHHAAGSGERRPCVGGSFVHSCVVMQGVAVCMQVYFSAVAAPLWSGGTLASRGSVRSLQHTRVWYVGAGTAGAIRRRSSWLQPTARQGASASQVACSSCQLHRVHSATSHVLHPWMGEWA
jgi:hypothetical protein